MHCFLTSLAQAHQHIMLFFKIHHLQVEVKRKPSVFILFSFFLDFLYSLANTQPSPNHVRHESTISEEDSINPNTPPEHTLFLKT